MSKSVFACEQCGAPLSSDDGHCLQCLLTGGFEADIASAKNEPATSSEPETLSGTRFYQHYEIQTRADGSLFELGRGAMGTTYKALDVNLQLPVALKVINADFSALPEARARFLREARAAARLRHPNVASVFHYGTLDHAEGDVVKEECFYAMEFVEGETLADRVHRDGPLAVDLVLPIALQIAQALAAAEKRGLIHRDLKPANIMLATDGGRAGEPSVKVIDFGLAKAVSAEGEIGAETFVTRGGFHGTPEFASPEQMASAELDVRSDIYSLGVTLWFLLTGELPFGGDSLGEMRDRQLHRPLPLERLQDARVPKPFGELLASMLSADPAQRPASAVALCDALEQCTQTRASFRKRFLIAAAFVIAGALAYAFISSRIPTPIADKSVAVLPLENLSDAKENAFFADGIQDDLLTSLGKIKDLKVISRSSVSHYKPDGARDVRTIGRELGVANLLEGSVRRSGDRVLVNVKLIEAKTNRQIWSERYDRKLSDALTLQGELATEIADALQATLEPDEKTRLREKLTGNEEAYVLYLRARSYEMQPTYLLKDFETAETLYAQAIALDPKFAIAHARLAAVLAYIYRNSTPSEELKKRAHGEADEALRLQPDLGEGHLARALCFYRIERDYSAALDELVVAKRFLPNDPGVDATVAFILRRQGKWREALARLNDALAHDPRNAQVAQDFANTYRLLRAWPEALSAADRAISLAPELPLLLLEKGYLQMWARGDLAPLKTALGAIPSTVDPDGVITWMRWDSRMLERDFAGAERAANSYAGDTLPSIGGAPLPKSYLRGCAALASGETERARALFESARIGMEAEVRKNPQNALRHARLGLLYAYLNLQDEAISEGRKACELQSERNDAFGGVSNSANLALIYAHTGDAGQALELIERLLTKPGAVFYFESSITVSDLRFRWQWDPLRDDPRFQKILSEPEPATRY